MQEGKKKVMKTVSFAHIAENLPSAFKRIQSALIISKFKGLSEILRDIHTLTYQICRIEEKIN